MRLIFWVTALAVLSIAYAKNSTTKAKPKRQLENIRTPQNLQYSLVLPHSRVSQFRSLTSSRRISNAVPRAGKLPPYAVQMEPVVQYSQKDPLYDPNLDNLDDAVVNKNEIYAQPKILNVQDQSGESYGPPYGSLPTAPLYSHGGHPQYYEAPEPIIEIIIKESNESLPAPPPQLIPKKKKEPVQVFYVKYSKDPYAKDKVVYDKPIPAITPPSNHEDDHDHHEDYVTVTPEPLYIPHETTTLRAIIKPESELYHSDSSVKVTFGNEGRHYSDRREGNTHTENHEETAPRPAIAHPQQPPNHPPLERSASPKPQYHESVRPASHSGPTPQTYRPNAQHAQSRIQFKQPYIPNEQQLPRQGPSISPFRAQTVVSRPLGPSPSPNAHGPFSNNAPGPITHFGSNGPNLPGPIGPTFPPPFSRPNNPPSFHSRQNPPSFGSRPHFNGPPRNAFHSGPQRPFHQPQPQQPYFDEPKYLQENYHTITTDKVEPPKDQPTPNRQPSFNFFPKPSPSPSPTHFQDLSRPQHIPVNQKVPQQRPPQQFLESHNKPSFAVSPSRSPFFNLKPSPPHIEDNRPPFHQFSSSQGQPQQPPFSFHQGPQSPPGLTPQDPSQQPTRNQHSFPGPVQSQPSPIPQNQFLPQPSSPPLFNFHAQPQPSPAPEQQNQFQISPSERPHFGPSHGSSERPFTGHANFQDQSNIQHQQNVGQFVPNGGELVAAIPKYEQHITVSGPTADYSGLGQPSHPTSAASQNAEQHYREQQQRHQQEQHHLQQQKQQQQQLRQQHQQYLQQQERQQQQQQQYQQQQQQYQQQQQQQQYQQQQQQQHQEQQQQQQNQEQKQQQQHQEQQQQQQQQYDAEQEQVRLQLAQNVQKQQDEIQRLQSQLLQAQQQPQYQQTQSRNNYNQQQFESSSPKYQFSNERPRQASYPTSTPAPAYYQSTSRTVEIKPTTQKYVSSTFNSISTTPEAKKEEKKKRPAVELPDEVPDDLRQQLLSSGILDNADISILDYDKVGDTPLDSLPPDQLANFFSAGGAQQIAASENQPIVVKPNGDFIQSRIDEGEEDDQEIAASENVPTYVAPPTQKQAVEMKVVHFDPKTDQGQNIAKEYVKEDATKLEPVALNDKKYNRYLPLKVSGNQFPLPDILKGRKVTSVVVLAPVETEVLNSDHSRAERAASTSLKGIKFVAGDSLEDLLKRPSKENFEKWLETEKNTESDLQSVILLVLGNEKSPDEKEIFMYDITSGNVNKLDGELSNAFVEAAENNSLSKDIEKLAIEGDGTPEKFDRDDEDENTAEASENVPLLVDLSGLSLDQENSNQVSISSGYSKMKLGRSLRRQ